MVNNELDPSIEDPDKVRATVDAEGLDWETQWLLEDEDSGEVITASKGDLDLDARLNNVDYSFLMGPDYKPSVFAYKLINFIKLVNGEEGEENESPIIHYDMFDQIPDHDQNLFVSFRGSAKALALDTLVMTPTGYVPIRDITTGDLVIDRNGEPTKVVCESKIFTNQCYKVLLADGNEFIANEDHYHVVQRRTQEPDHSMPRKANGKYYTKNVWVEEELTTKEILDKGPVYNESLSNKSKWYIPLINKPIEFTYEKPQMDPYTVGVILGDGGICKNRGAVRITSHAEDVEELMSYIPYKLGEVFEDKRHPTTKRFGILGVTQILKKFIGVNGTYTKEIPESLLFGSIKDRIRVLQGLMDTDGSITPRGQQRFTSVSKPLAQGVEHIVKSLGGYCKVSHYSNDYAGYFSVTFSIPDINPFRLTRKAVRWQNKPYKGGERVGVVSITPIDEVIESKCISVASDTRTFLLENSVITRNTTALHEYMILYLAVYGEVDGFGKVDVGIYISDTMDNGVKSMRTNLEYRWNNSSFLQKYVPNTKFTDVRWEFENIDKKKLCFRGFGASALPLDTLLHTETGTTTIKDVQIGDLIYGADGKLCTVQVKSEIFNRPVYQLNLIDGRSLQVCEEHINNVVISYNSRYKCELREENIVTKELIKKPLYKTRANRRSKEHRVYIKNIQAIQYPEKEVFIDPYTLGLLLGDGSLRADGSTTFHCHKKDLPTYLKYIPYRVGTQYLDKRNKNVVTLSLLGLSSKIAKLGLKGIPMNQKFIPKEYFNASIEQRTALVAGLIDTDGHITKNGRIEFVNTSKQLCKDLAKLIVTLGGSAVVRPAYIKGRHNDNGFDRKNAYKCEIWIMSESICRIERKQKRLRYNKTRQRWVKHANMVAIDSITQIEQVPTQCIGVSSSDHLFIAGNDYIVTHNTGVRGFKEYGKRPTWLGLDDLMSDKNAQSPTIQKDIKHIIYKAARQALHPQKRMQIWTGTPFNKSDPLYEAAGSGAWNTRVYPICEKFPCSKEEFIGGWPDRFSYNFVKKEFRSLRLSKEIASFNQELMLRITSDEDRLVFDDDLVWYKRSSILQHKSRYNFYVTTDFATSNGKKSDFSVISVWAYTHNGEWLLVDGMCKRQLMDENIKQLFHYVSVYKPLEVGIEINGQQQGFIQWIKGQMVEKNIFFNLAGRGKTEGIRRTGNKLDSFKLFVPIIKAKKVWLPEELQNTPYMDELHEELRFVTGDGFKSKHDDVCDTLSMLLELNAYKPSEEIVAEYVTNEDGTYGYFPLDEEDIYRNSTVF